MTINVIEESVTSKRTSPLLKVNSDANYIDSEVLIITNKAEDSKRTLYHEG